MKQAIALAIFTVPVAAQSTWAQVFPLVSPPARDTHGMAYEPFSRRVVLCGGFNVIVGHSSDTWEWDGTNWAPIQPAVRPMGRETFGFCPDGTGGILMFGGYTAIPGGPPNRVFNDTWRYFQGTWTQLLPAQSPSPRRWPAMTLSNQGVILFGGSDRTRVVTYGDTWRWNGTNWTPLAPALSPPARWGHWMTYDTNRNVAVMFGGAPTEPSPRLADTWEFDGSTWIQRTSLASPSPRTEATMVFSQRTGRTILFGGQDIQNRLNDTWEWDGLNWTSPPTPAAPSPRDSVGLAYDAARQSVVLFGGYGANGSSTSSLGGTFRYLEGVASASFVPFGGGCRGAAGLPNLSPVGAEVPRLGTTSRLRASNLSTDIHVVIMVIGLSTTQNSGPNGSYGLPFDLAPFGMPGCYQYVAGDFMDFLIALSGQADWSLNVPNSPGLAGAILHAQALSTETPTSRAVTNAVSITVGY